MSDINVSVPFQIPQDEALRRVRASIAELTTRYADKLADLQENWNGYDGSFSASTFGQLFAASVVVHPSEVTVQLGIPLIAVLLKDTIESVIRSHLEALLA